MVDHNLTPHAEAVVAMTLWSDRYSKQLGGCMDFWEGLSDAKQETCVRIVDQIRDARRADGSPPIPSLAGVEPTEEMLIAGEEAYHSAPRDEDGCTQMAAAFKAMLRHLPPSPTPILRGSHPDQTSPMTVGPEAFLSFGEDDIVEAMVLSLCAPFPSANLTRSGGIDFWREIMRNAHRSALAQASEGGQP